MRKVLGGHVYDTDKATALGSYDNGEQYNNIGWAEETLYRTRSGLYFLFGEGGPATRYAKPDGTGSWIGSELISPISGEAAKAWAEEHLDGDTYIAAFGDPEEEAASRIVMSVSLTPAARSKLEDMAAGGSMSAVMERLINEA